MNVIEEAEELARATGPYGYDKRKELILSFARRIVEAAVEVCQQKALMLSKNQNYIGSSGAYMCRDAIRRELLPEESCE